MASARAHFAKTCDADRSLRIAGNARAFGSIDGGVLISLAKNGTDFVGALMTLPRNLRCV